MTSNSRRLKLAIQSPLRSSGNFCWDLGAVCFGNPLDIPEAVREKRRKAKEVWESKKRAPGDLNRKRDYKYRNG